MSARVRRLALTAVLGASVLTGCSDDEPALANNWSVAAAVKQVPASTAESRLWLVTADVTAALEAGDIKRGGADDMDWLVALSGFDEQQSPAVFVPTGSGYGLDYAANGGLDEVEEMVGWSFLDVDSFVESGLPPRTLTISAGDFDEDTLSGDLVEVADGVVSTSDAADGTTDLANTNALSRIGAPVRLSEQDGLIAMSTSTELVQEWRDGEASLGSEDRVAALAEALDDQDVYAAVLSDPASAEGVSLGRANPEQLEMLNKDAPQQSFDAVGIGWSVDDGEPLVHVAYHFANAREAGQGAEALEGMWRDGISVRDMRPYAERFEVDEVDHDGPVVTITLLANADGRPQTALQMLQSAEPVFFSR